MPKLGFVRKLDRVEYKKAVDQLPSDEGSLIIWKTAKELSWIEQHILLVADGDPETDPTDDPIKYIQDFLADPMLIAGPDDAPQGNLVMWRGISRLTDIEIGYELAKSCG